MTCRHDERGTEGCKLHYYLLPDPHCKDKSNRCQAHAKKGFCAKESSMYTFMSIQCQRTCNVCPPCKDKLKKCPTYAKKGYCSMGHFMFQFMFRTCPQTCSRCGDSQRPHQHDTTSLPPPRTVESPPCKDKLKICSTYAKKGYCYMGHTMFPFMFRTCPQTCNRCGDSQRPHQHDTTSLPPPRTVESDGDSQPPQQQETTSLPPPRTDENPHCKDKSNRCQAHAKKGFCAKESSMYTFMSIQCQRTCNVCPPCKDKLKKCPTYAKKGYCSMGHFMFQFMFRTCPQTCSRCGDSERPHQHDTTSLPPPRTVESDGDSQPPQQHETRSLPPPRTDENPHCKDKSNRCQAHAKKGFCAKESSMYTFMSIYCRRTCNVCPPCKDKLKICPTYAKKGYCYMGHTMFPFMFRTCPQTCNRCGDSERPHQHETTSLPPPRTVENPHNCKDDSNRCQAHAKKGFCAKENYMYSFMSKQCQRTCNVCPPCKDKLKKCPTYAEKGYCYVGQSMFSFMYRTCPESCNRCGHSERPYQHETTSLPTPRTVESLRPRTHRDVELEVDLGQHTFSFSIG
ncbi:uncharacterized protein [Haliotis cracherodii]|uniref:uncharacterized protein n=1 Tax=Haliotis cracherodii TaxID=6455 RepID=UPI0039EC806F